MAYDPNTGEWISGLYRGEGVNDPSSLDPNYWRNIYQGIQSGGVPADWKPRMENIPSFEQWSQSYTGDADPYEQYLGTHYQMPSNRAGGFGGVFNDYIHPLGITGAVEGNKAGYYSGQEALAKEYYDNPELYTQLTIAGMGAGAGIQAGLAGGAGTGAGSAAFAPAEGLGGVSALGETALPAADLGFFGSSPELFAVGAETGASEAFGLTGMEAGIGAGAAGAYSMPPGQSPPTGVGGSWDYGGADPSAFGGGGGWSDWLTSGRDFLGGSSILGTGIRTLPALAAINYARNVDPFDTSMLRADYASIDPNSLAFPYDIESGKGRGRLTSSLTNRGVMGSSFANQDLSTYDTMRGLGRQNLLTQGAIARSDISNKILQAQIAEREQKNRLYGSALLALSGGLNPRQSMLDKYI